MADIVLFMRQGWKNTWRLDIIWLFSALPLLEQFSRLAPIKQDGNLFWSFLSLVEMGFFIVLSYVSTIGVPYIAYCYSVGKSVTISETLLAVKRYSGRVIGFSFLILLVLSPFLCWALIVSINNSTPPQLSDKTLLAFSPIALFSAMWDFTILSFFAYDLGIRQSIKKAWALFMGHFDVLALLGIIMAIIIKVFSATAGISTMLIQSGFDIASLSNFSFINPSASLNKNWLFILTNGLFLTVFTPFSASVFVLAYLKYGKVNKSSLMSQK